MAGDGDTFYDRLGLTPTASPDQIKRAYASLARANHPDRRPEDERDEAGATMAALNEAWRVLRDPQRRADYDRSIGAGPAVRAPGDATASPTAARPAAGSPSPSSSVRAPGPATVIPPATVGRASWSGCAIAIGAVVVIAVLLIGAVLAYVATTPAPDPEPTVPVAGYEVGECVVVTSSSAGLVAIEVPCGSAVVSGRIEAVRAYPSPCPGSTTEVALVAERMTLCLGPV